MKLLPKTEDTIFVYVTTGSDIYVCYNNSSTLTLCCHEKKNVEASVARAGEKNYKSGKQKNYNQLRTLYKYS